MGPRIESVPAQNSRIAVDSPLDSSELPEILPTARSKTASRSSPVPIRPPRARLTIKST